MVGAAVGAVPTVPLEPPWEAVWAAAPERLLVPLERLLAALERLLVALVPLEPPPPRLGLRLLWAVRDNGDGSGGGDGSDGGDGSGGSEIGSGSPPFGVLVSGMLAASWQALVFGP